MVFSPDDGDKSPLFDLRPKRDPVKQSNEDTLNSLHGFSIGIESISFYFTRPPKLLHFRDSVVLVV